MGCAAERDKKNYINVTETYVISGAWAARGASRTVAGAWVLLLIQAESTTSHGVWVRSCGPSGSYIRCDES